MQIEAIARHTTADLVVERIAQVIKERRLSAGERLPGELELVEQLKVILHYMMTPNDSRTWIARDMACGKKPLPSPRNSGVGRFHGERMWQLYSSQVIGAVLRKQSA